MTAVDCSISRLRRLNKDRGQEVDGRERDKPRDGFGGGLVAVMFDFLPNSLQPPGDREQLQGWKSHHLAS